MQSVVRCWQRRQQRWGGVVDNDDGGQQQRQRATPTAWARTSRHADRAHAAAVKCIGGGMAGAIVQDDATFCSDLSPPLLKLPTAIGDPSPPIACGSQSNKNTKTSTLPPKRNFRQIPTAFPPPNCCHFHPQPSIPAISFTTRNPSLNRASFQTKQALLKSTTLKK